MALEHLFTNMIEEGIEMAVHPEANYFTCKSGKIFQLHSNPGPTKRMREIPKGANTFIAEVEAHSFYLSYRVCFFSHMGNILKTYEF